MCASSRRGATTSTRPPASSSSDPAGRLPMPTRCRTAGRSSREYLRRSPPCRRSRRTLKLGATVTAITREGLDKVSSSGRERSPPSSSATRTARREHRVRARAVIDASGTWTQPNPIGVDGLAVSRRNGGGEIHRLRHSGRDGDLSANNYAGKRMLVIGSGHSAINVALALMELQEATAQPKSSGRFAATASTSCSAAG